MPARTGFDNESYLELNRGASKANSYQLFLEIPGLRPVMQFERRYSLQSAAGKSMKSELHDSINRFGARWEK